MDAWEEFKAYVAFGTSDVDALARLLEVAEDEFPGIADRFYAAAARFPEARAVFRDQAQIERLKGTLQVWMRDMLRGPHDAAHWEQRRAIGRTHVKIGLPERYVFAAMNLIRQELIDIARARLGEASWGQAVAALLRVTDIELAVIASAYREAHEAVQLRSLQDIIIGNLPVMVLCLDDLGVVTAATAPGGRVFGHDASVDTHFEEFLPRPLVEAADLPSAVGRALATGTVVKIPRVVVGAGRDARTYRIVLVPLQHEFARMLVHIEDLSDVIQAEARAQQAEELARVGRLAANVAHEIRNPLTAISATLQVIGGTLPPDDRRRPVLVKVQEQVLRLDRLVSDLLGYSRPVEARLAPLSLEPVAREAISASGVSAGLEAVGDPTALGDAQYVQQILINLLQNASDATGPGGKVEVHVGPGPEVRIADDGPGVAPAVLPSLFEPFVTTKTRGTGLGLAISRKYAEAMGGRLELLAPAAPPGGAVFRLVLPPCGPAPEAGR